MDCLRCSTAGGGDDISYRYIFIIYFIIFFTETEANENTSKQMSQGVISRSGTSHDVLYYEIDYLLDNFKALFSDILETFVSYLSLTHISSYAPTFFQSPIGYLFLCKRQGIQRIRIDVQTGSIIPVHANIPCESIIEHSACIHKNICIF